MYRPQTLNYSRKHNRSPLTTALKLWTICSDSQNVCPIVNCCSPPLKSSSFICLICFFLLQEMFMQIFLKCKNKSTEAVNFSTNLDTFFLNDELQTFWFLLSRKFRKNHRLLQVSWDPLLNTKSDQIWSFGLTFSFPNNRSLREAHLRFRPTRH